MKLPIFLTLLLLLPQAAPVTGDGKTQGRRGNTLYNQEQYQEASEVYSVGGFPWIHVVFERTPA